MLEVQTGVAFAQWSRLDTLERLGMNDSGWFLADFEGRTDLAIGYDANHYKTNETGVSPYPIGNLRASAYDLALFAKAWVNGGDGLYGQLLSPETIDDALSAQYPTEPGTKGSGFYWGRWTTMGGKQVWAHGGSLAGGCNRITIDPVNRTAFVVLINSPCATGVSKYINELEDYTFDSLDALVEADGG